jgi:putative phosphoribosyl transferase
MFKDRREAGRRLAQELMRFKDRDPVVLARPRNGVPVGFEVAAALEAPLDVIFVRRIAMPAAPGGSAGAVVGTGRFEVFVNEPGVQACGVDLTEVDEEARLQLDEVSKLHDLYRSGREPLPLQGRTAILVEDGVGTGATTRAMLRCARHAGPDRLILAAPVAPLDVIESMRQEADEIVVIERPRERRAIASFYQRYDQTSDEEIRHYLDISRPH